ncbi:MAG: hypothetical protein U0172_07265 [Nitrospiraceae bacterium]
MPGLKLVLACTLFVMTVTDAAAKRRTHQTDVSHRSGIPPLKNGVCPDSHPIKGNFTPHSGERCIYHMDTQRFYARTKAERCYQTEVEALEDGCRKSKR